MADQRPASNDNPRRTGGGPPGDRTPKYAAYIVVGALVILALQGGFLRHIVQ